MIDLTKITTPFGLLDAETQEALKAHGGPYQLWCGDLWSDRQHNGDFDSWYTYRVKPDPPKPREWWITTWDNIAHDSEADAIDHNAGFDMLAGKTIHVREVLP